jgi:hypothetical protein
MAVAGDLIQRVRRSPSLAVGTPLWRWGPPAAVAAAAATVVGYVGAVDPNQAGHYPTCPFLFLTGYYCPGCGSLRGIHALAHGDLMAAIDHNVLMVAALPYLVAGYLGWLRRRGWDRPRTWLAPPWVIWALLVVVLAYWVLRNVPAFSWLAP